MRLASVRRHGQTRLVADRPGNSGQLVDLQRALVEFCQAEARTDIRLANYGADMMRFLSGGRAAIEAALGSLSHIDGIPDSRLEMLGILVRDVEVEFEPVVPSPGRILCVGRNYLEHARESGREIPDRPIFFVRFPSSLVGHRQPLVLPEVSERLDWEGELAIVIGERCRRLEPEGAMAVVAGYSIFNDGSVRDYQHHGSQWTAGKNFFHSGSFGPFLVTADQAGSAEALNLETRVNGVVMQQANTADLIFSIPELLAYVTEWQPLEPGDVIATGTPAGIGGARNPPVFLKAGDEVSVSIDGLGSLVNSVVNEK